jgi:uncharacterized repeat protein (TIGR03803 family)
VIWSYILRAATPPALALMVALVPLGIASHPVQAQSYTESVLHKFTGTNGAYPFAGLVRDGAGNMYGTASSGGASNYGTVFKLNEKGKETVLHSFTGGVDGGTPYASLVRDAAGNLYGTTYVGGTSRLGTVFKVDTTGKETVLHSFVGGTDGSLPAGGLLLDAKGDLYGTTQTGGAYGQGTVFKVSASGKETVLHMFAGGDGANPSAAPILDKKGNLFGTTGAGGAWNVGTVFKLTKKGKETVLYSFTGTGGDGAYPGGGILLQDSADNLYGATYEGGNATCSGGCGTVFKVTQAGVETVLYNFTGTGGDGAYPAAGLIQDAAGNFYSTTIEGGASNSGTVFKLNKSGKEVVLYSFTGGADGWEPFFGNLLRDATGNLYGMTNMGGDPSCGGGYGCGVVFKLHP